MRLRPNVRKRIREVSLGMGDGEYGHSEMAQRLGLEWIGVLVLRRYLVGTGIVWDKKRRVYRKEKGYKNPHVIISRRIAAFKDRHGI